MTALDEAALLSGQNLGVESLKLAMWGWLREHWDDEVMDIKVWKLFKVTIKVSDLHSLWTRLFGMEPVL